MKPNINLVVAMVTMLFLGALPAAAQTIDLSRWQTLLQGFVDEMTGGLGLTIASLVLIGLFLSWFFAIVDLRQALWTLLAIVGVGSAPLIAASIFTP